MAYITGGGRLELFNSELEGNLAEGAGWMVGGEVTLHHSLSIALQATLLLLLSCGADKRRRCRLRWCRVHPGGHCEGG